jgi:hypothetical protein
MKIMNDVSRLIGAMVIVSGIFQASAVAAETDGLEMIGSMGKGQTILADRQEFVLFEYAGEGMLTHFWCGGNFAGVEDTRIRYYIDGEEVPSIDMDLYMGHGIGFNNQKAPWTTQYIGKLGKGNGVYNNYRIPFGSQIKVTAQRSDAALGKNPRIWWIIRGVKNGQVNLGGVKLPREARLKLHRIEGKTFDVLEEFDLCDVAGKGALFQVAMQGKSENVHYLEACVRAYQGGRKEPLMVSSGLEDYFLGTYYFDTGHYYADMAGLTHFDKQNGEFAAYRIHDADPIFFQDGFRLTCRVGETKRGTLEGRKWMNPLPTTYTTYAWVYQW